MLGFTYNSASQIVARSASNDAYAWTGANASRTYAVNGLNQYTSASSATFGYDPNGNLASTINAPWSTAYVYDVENRLVSATGTHSAELVYDPLGRLAQVSSGGANVRRLVYDGDALVAEYDVNGNMPHRYIHGNDSESDDPLIWYDNFASGWRRALVADHQGSVIGVADMSGNSVATNSYDPWGLPGATPSGRFGYTGQAWVPELGLWYYKARFYSPTLGRFLQTDPIGYKDQINLYAYAANDPVNLIDPQGEEIVYASHRVGGVGPQHSKLIIIPQNQKRWRNTPLFKQGGVLPDGRRYVSLGGGPDNGSFWNRGNLVGNFNRPTDLNMQNDVQRVTLGLPKGLTEDQAIARFIKAEANYRDNLDYDLSPSMLDDDGYNSNGYTSGMLRATGFNWMLNRNMMGGSKPVPFGCFTPQQTGCR